MSRPLLRLFYLLIAAIALFELFLGNLFTLAFNLAPAAREAGLAPQTEAVRLVLLAILDAAAGIGALAASEAVRRGDVKLLKKASLVAFAGFAGYGAYQLLSAWLLLTPEFRLPAALIGVVYAILGGLAFAFGRDQLVAQAGTLDNRF